jgi:hypothetical protein
VLLPLRLWQLLLGILFLRRVNEYNGYELEVKFDGNDETFAATEFVGGSFAHELIQLIEKHLLVENLLMKHWKFAM